MGPAFAGPMAAFIQAGHGGGQAVRQGVRAAGSIEQLAEPLVGEAVGAHASIAVGQLAYPAHRIGPVRGFLAKAAKVAF